MSQKYRKINAFTFNLSGTATVQTQETHVEKEIAAGAEKEESKPHTGNCQ